MSSSASESRSNESDDAKRRALKEREWACIDSKCAKVNDESVIYCEDCGKPKPKSTKSVGKELGKEMADKSKGLFAAEDWMCSKCGNVNWARRKTCNVCNAPKVADLERRTGYGGGYNDRQDVEYVKRDYKEEFDEFGRIKKRKGEDSDEKDEEETMETEEKNEVGQVEDEEDEDEDDEDLDKYNFNFDSDPELAEKVESIKNKQVAGTANGGTGSTACDESDCSCSCSGGECSCPESEDEKEKDRRKVHKSSRERDRERNDRRRSSSRDRRREKKRSRSRDRGYGRDDRKRRSRSRDRTNRRSRSRSRDRRRDDERRREKDRRRW